MSTISQADSLISDIRHPYWRTKVNDWRKWRLVFEGSEEFVNTYLEKFSRREDQEDFNRRKKITPTPNFAKSSVIEIGNSIHQRLVDVTRRGGSQSYQSAIDGLGFGVDLHGSSMNSFLGLNLIPELLPMSRVGLFVDMPQLSGVTLQSQIGENPYVYQYRAEQILSWKFMPGRPDEFKAILLQDFVEETHHQFGLPEKSVERFRLMFIDENDGRVHIRFYERFQQGQNTLERQITPDGQTTDEDIILDINIIPFILVELSDSLLANIANHQIALLNLESSDIGYALLSNFPFYTEQRNQMDNNHLKPAAGGDDGTTAQANTSKDRDIEVGSLHGRRYPQQTDRPGFIHPSSEPLKASMEKQQQLKNDIRDLVNLNLSNIKPKLQSAESKEIDERGLEAGLSAIGLVLEAAERKMAKYWAMWEGTNTTTVATVKYPENWSLKTDDSRRDEAKQLQELRNAIPSTTFSKHVSKELARTVLGSKLSVEDLDEIIKEIDEASAVSADPDIIFSAVEKGLLDNETAAQLLGYPKEVVAKAAKDHAERIARIAAAQSAESGAGARGTEDLDDSPGTSGSNEKTESRETDEDDVATDKTRGEAK